MSSASSSLTDALRAALLDPAEAAALEVHGRVDAAVLVPLYVTGDGLHAVFTRRPRTMRRHAGEISFPGGRRDEGEDDLSVTALREAEEEIGLPRADVELLGALEPTPTVATNYAVYPFVGLIEPGREWELSPREVDQVLEFSLADLRAGYGRRRLIRRGIPFRTDVYVVDDPRGAGGHQAEGGPPSNIIWGATARMVGNLLARLGPLLDDGAI